MRAGDAVVFPPRSVHGIDVSASGRMYCLELMQPNDMFAGAHQTTDFDHLIQVIACNCQEAAQHAGGLV